MEWLKKCEKKTDAFKNTWKSLKFFEKALIIGFIITGIGMIIKGCWMLCG